MCLAIMTSQQSEAYVEKIFVNGGVFDFCVVIFKTFFCYLESAKVSFIWTRRGHPGWMGLFSSLSSSNTRRKGLLTTEDEWESWPPQTEPSSVDLNQIPLCEQRISCWTSTFSVTCSGSYVECVISIILLYIRVVDEVWTVSVYNVTAMVTLSAFDVDWICKEESILFWLWHVWTQSSKDVGNSCHLAKWKSRPSIRSVMV